MPTAVAQVSHLTEAKLETSRTFDTQKEEALKSETISRKIEFAPSHYDDEHTSKYLAGIAQPLSQIHIPEVVQEEVYNAIDNLGKDLGRPSISRRMLLMNHLIAELAEKHIAGKKDDEFQKKQKMKGNVGDQQSWMNWQAASSAAGGFAAPICALLGSVLGGSFGNALTKSSEFLPHVVGIPTKIIDGKMKPLEHERGYWVNTVSSEKQSQEGLKNIPEQLRNFVLEISRAEQKAFESMGQMR